MPANPDLIRTIGETRLPDDIYGGTVVLQELLEDEYPGAHAHRILAAIAERVTAWFEMHPVTDAEVEAAAKAYAESAHWAWSCSPAGNCLNCDRIRDWLMADSVEAAQAKMIGRARAALEAARRAREAPMPVKKIIDGPGNQTPSRPRPVE